jgi:hypothetical protein
VYLWIFLPFSIGEPGSEFRYKNHDIRTLIVTSKFKALVKIKPIRAYPLRRSSATRVARIASMNIHMNTLLKPLDEKNSNIST